MPVMSNEYMRAYHESRPLYHTWQHGWSVRDALTTPVRTYTRKAA